MVRAKFVVDRISKIRFGHHEIAMSPVVSGSEENKKFWQYTPGGEIKVNCVNTDAVEQFEVGKEYYVDFSPAITDEQILECK
ncbi:MAG: hypothetical protein WA118_08170 [Carboxydocellales bacterium]